MPWTCKIIRLRVATFLAVGFGCCVASASAQDPSGLEQGLKPFGSYEGGKIDSISVVNGGLSLHIPLLSYPQRGGDLSVSFSIGYNTPLLQPQGTWVCPKLGACLPSDVAYFLITPQGGSPNPIGTNVMSDFLRYAWPNLKLTPDSNSPASAQIPPGGSGSSEQLIDYSVTEADGAVHHLGTTGSASSTNWLARDASGYTLNSSTFLFTARNGVRYQATPGPELESGGYPEGVLCCGPVTSIEDTNGNRINAIMTPSNIPGDPAGTKYLTGWTDTLGKTIPTLGITSPMATTATTNYSNCTGTLTVTSANIWNMPGLNGGTSPYKLCNAKVPVTAPSFLPCPNSSNAMCSSYPPTLIITQIQSIVLPDLSAWTFAYNSNGLLSQITLPTGGTIAYTWGWSQNCTGPLFEGVFPVYHPYIETRTVTDSTGSHQWTYAGSGSTMTVTDPLNNKTVHTITDMANQCTSAYETEADEYSAGTLIRKTQTQYSSTSDPFETGNQYGTTVMNVVPTSVTTTDVPTSQVTQTTTSYDTGIPEYAAAFLGSGTANAILGEVIQQNIYDIGPNAPGALLRQQKNQYMASSGPNAASYMANNLIDLLYTKQVLDGSGTQMALTQYNYDEATPAASPLSASAFFDTAPQRVPTVEITRRFRAG